MCRPHDDLSVNPSPKGSYYCSRSFEITLGVNSAPEAQTKRNNIVAIVAKQAKHAGLGTIKRTPDPTKTYYSDLWEELDYSAKSSQVVCMINTNYYGADTDTQEFGSKYPHELMLSFNCSVAVSTSFYPVQSGGAE